MQPEIKIEYVPVDALKPYERNTRKHEERDILAIKASIEQFGFNDPIGIWHDTIVEGHGRLLAAKELGMTEVPIIRLDHMTNAQRKAYAIAHNKTAELSTWDWDILDAELGDLQFDMSAFGFEKVTQFSPEDLEEFFVEAYTPERAQEAKEKKLATEQTATNQAHKTTITCPHCGEVIEL